MWWFTREKRVEKKVALCFLISYTHDLHQESLWREWIEELRDIVNVYVHYKHYDKIRSPWLRAHAIPLEFTQRTIYENVVPAYFSLLAFSFYHDASNQWFCMLTDTCAPLVTPTEFRRRFAALGDRTIMTVRPAYWNMEMYNRANLSKLAPHLHLANDPWFVMTRSHVETCLSFLKVNHSMYTTVTAGSVANESIFAIILAMRNGSMARLLNAPSNVADWVRPSTASSPHYFYEASDGEMAILRTLIEQHPHCLFGRKFNMAFPATALRQLAQERAPLDLTPFAPLPAPSAPSAPAPSASSAHARRRIVRLMIAAVAVAALVAAFVFLDFRP